MGRRHLATSYALFAPLVGSFIFTPRTAAAMVKTPNETVPVILSTFKMKSLFLLSASFTSLTTSIIREAACSLLVSSKLESSDRVRSVESTASNSRIISVLIFHSRQAPFLQSLSNPQESESRLLQIGDIAPEPSLQLRDQPCPAWIRAVSLFLLIDGGSREYPAFLEPSLHLVSCSNRIQPYPFFLFVVLNMQAWVGLELVDDAVVVIDKLAQHILPCA